MQIIYALVPIHVDLLSLTRSKSHSFTSHFHISILALYNQQCPTSIVYKSVQSKGQGDDEVLTVLPSQNMVVAWQGNSASSETFPLEMNSILKMLIEANTP